MDDLLKIAGNVMDNFNPETDSANDFENLPDGQYKGLLTEVKGRKNEKGTQWVGLQFEILDGDYKGRFIFVNYFFTEKTAERSIKTIIKLIHNLGFEPLTVDAFKSVDDLAEALQGLVGTEAAIKQATSKSGFTNYDVSPIAE